MDFEEILGIDQLDLYFDTSVEGFDGECFSYSVYFDSSTAEEMLADVEAAMEDAVDAFGGVEPEDNNAAIHTVLKALNDVKGIKNVVINEGSGFDF